MSDDSHITDKDLFEQGAAGLVATLTLAASSSGVSLPVQGAMAMVGSLIGLGFGRSVYRAAKRRYPAFARGFLRAFDPDPVKAGEKAKAAGERGITESLDDTMMRSFRQMMDAVDENVVPVLGYMAGLYAFERKRPDAVFRGLGRLLCDLEPGELDQLVRLIKLNGASLYIDYKGIVHADKSSEGNLPSAKRIFALLKREGLGGQYFPDADQNDPQDPFMPDAWIWLDESPISELRRILL